MNKLSPGKVRMLGWIILAAGAGLGFAGAFAGHKALVVMGVLIMFGSQVFRWICYRCPHCGKYLDRSTGGFCPYCGKNISR